MKRFFILTYMFLCAIFISAQTLYVRGAHNNWAADAANQMTQTAPGVYTISGITLTGAFKIADASWSASANWGAPSGASSLVVPGVTYKAACSSDPGNLTVEKTTECQLLTLNTNDSTILIEAAPEPQPEIAGPALWPAQSLITAPLPKTVKVLSMNNSLIHYENEWQDDMFNQIASSMGKDAHWTAHTNLGKTLDYHYNEGEGMTEAGTPSARMLVRTEAWTHIILQEQTAKPRTNFAGFRQSVIKWVEYIRENCPNPNAVIIVPMNWAYNTDPFTEFNAAFYQAYRDIAQEFGIVICPVGRAYQLAYEQNTGILQTWFKDDRHPTQRATYMAACLEYAVIFGEDPTTISWSPATITESVASEMRTAAYNAWSTYPQTVNMHSGCVHYEMRLLDTNGMSVEILPKDSLVCVAELGTYPVALNYEDTPFSATLVRDTAVTVVPQVDAVELDENGYSENFNSLPVVTRSTADPKGMKYRSDLPLGWRIDRNLSGPRQIGMFHHAADTLMYFGGVSLASNAYNGTWNWGADDDPDRAVGGLTTSVDNGTRAINLMLALRNISSSDLALTVGYAIEKYRAGNNASGFTVQLYYSLDGVNWTSAGDAFKTVYAADAATQGYTTVPADTRSVSAELPVNATSGELLFLAWNISVSSGTNCAGAPGLAIDDVRIAASSTQDIPSLLTAPSSPHKILKDGHLLILRDSQTFTLTGQEVK